MFDLLINIIEGIKNQAIYEDHIMDQRYRPPRIFGQNNVLIPFDYVPAMGKDIIRRIKIKEIEIETVLFFDELEITQGKKKIFVQVVLSDMRLVYVYVF